MKIDCLPFGLYGENSYVLHDHDHVLLIDPGRYPDEIAKCINENETVDAILLTHGHEDHTGAADDLADKYTCPVYLHHDDLEMIVPEDANYYHALPIYTKITEYTEGQMKIGTFDVTIYHTPGHTHGSVLIQYRNRLFTGDTLFAGTIGRTDLAGGDPLQMKQSLAMIKTLPGDLWVYPGHGGATTIGDEKKVNPYLYYGEADLD